jgi:hypothetical protein
LLINSFEVSTTRTTACQDERKNVIVQNLNQVEKYGYVAINP